ncbi:MAG: DUF2065 family protein [Cognatishimia sp.]
MIATAFLALGIILIFEGLAYTLAPSLIEELLKSLKSLTLKKRRAFGALACGLGIVMVLVAQIISA